MGTIILSIRGTLCPGPCLLGNAHNGVLQTWEVNLYAQSPGIDSLQRLVSVEGLGHRLRFALSPGSNSDLLCHLR